MAHTNSCAASSTRSACFAARRAIYSFPRGSPELLPLARRMNYHPEAEEGDMGEMLLRDFKQHTEIVRKFIRARFRRGRV